MLIVTSAFAFLLRVKTEAAPLLLEEVIGNSYVFRLYRQ